MTKHQFFVFFETYFDSWLISLVETVTFLWQTLFKCQTSLLMQIYKKKIAYFQLSTSIIVGTAFLLLFLLSACYKKQDTILAVVGIIFVVHLAGVHQKRDMSIVEPR